MQHKRGFTLVELLVVIAIIGILVALLLPAINAAREASRKTKCVNTLKQLALGINTYTEARKSLPPGKTVLPITVCANSGAVDYSNWALEILPYIEETVLYKMYDFTLPNDHSTNRPVVQTTMGYMTCPSDPNGSRRGIPTNLTTEFASGSYKGVAGKGYFSTAAGLSYFDSARMDGAELSAFDSGALPVTLIPGKTSSCPYAQINPTAVKPRKISDGVSKTLLLGEYTTTSTLARSGYWANSYYGMNLASIIVPTSCKTNPATCNASTLMPSLDPDYDYCDKAITAIGPRPGKDVCARTFAGIHVGGTVNFSRCDGSVTPVNYSAVDLKVLAALATIAGGENVGDPQ